MTVWVCEAEQKRKFVMVVRRAGCIFTVDQFEIFPGPVIDGHD